MQYSKLAIYHHDDPALRPREQATATRNASTMEQDTDDQSEGTEYEKDAEDMDVDENEKEAQPDVLPPTRHNGGKAVGQGRV